MMRLLKSIIATALSLIVSINIAYGYSNILFFGDSLTDMGNLVTAPYTNDPGIMWPHIVTQHYGIPLAASGLKGDEGGNNWAVAGATSALFLEKIEDFVLSNHSVNPDDLVFLWIGSNDMIYKILNKWPRAEPTDKVVQEAISNITTAIFLLQQVGAQHIVLMNLFSIDITPYAQYKKSRHGDEVLDVLKQAISQFNTALANLSSPSVIYFDSNAKLKVVLDNYEAYGFTNITERLKKCHRDCNPDAYLFWDAVHPTNAAHKLIGEFVIEFLEGGNI